MVHTFSNCYFLCFFHIAHFHAWRCAPWLALPAYDAEILILIASLCIVLGPVIGRQVLRKALFLVLQTRFVLRLAGQWTVLFLASHRRRITMLRHIFAKVRGRREGRLWLFYLHGTVEPVEFLLFFVHD